MAKITIISATIVSGLAIFSMDANAAECKVTSSKAGIQMYDRNSNRVIYMNPPRYFSAGEMVYIDPSKMVRNVANVWVYQISAGRNSGYYISRSVLNCTQYNR